MATYTASPPGAFYVAPQYGFRQDISAIRDWLIWSIINIFVGMGGGILPLIFSLICRSKKQSGDAEGARTMSTVALILNILSTIAGVIAWINVLVFGVILASIASVNVN